MKGFHHNMNGHSRRDAGARVCGWAGFVAVSFAGVVAMQSVLTAKINPRWVPGGLLREGNP
jgi:hypothetical protein